MIEASLQLFSPFAARQILHEAEERPPPRANAVHRLQLPDDHFPTEVGRAVARRVLRHGRSEERLGRLERGLPAVSHQVVELGLQHGGATVEARLGVGGAGRLVLSMG